MQQKVFFLSSSVCSILVLCLFLFVTGITMAKAEDSPIISVDQATNTISIKTSGPGETAFLLAQLKEITQIKNDGTTVVNPASWEMNDPVYEKHEKSLVIFNHQAHFLSYEITCGKCHHDKNGTPLIFKVIGPVDKCSLCHKETKRPAGEKLETAEKIKKYHKEALHAKCIGCHKIQKSGPTKCTDCHIKITD